MRTVRVYELAKQYGLTNEQMINFLMNKFWTFAKKG